MPLKVKSIASFASLEKIADKLNELGFVLESSAIMVSEGKFWNRMLYIKGEEMIFVSDEIGDTYPKDPVVTIYGLDDTIEKITGVLY